MCLAIPGQIIQVRDGAALVDFQGNRLEVCTIVTPEAVAGDWVLVHAGFAITRLDEETARQTWTYLDEIQREAARDVVSAGGAADG